MPELPEVETVRRGLSPALEGKRLARVEVRRADLRFPFPDKFAERLEGQTLLRLGRKAKFLAADFSSGDTLIMHLGMSGRFTIEDTSPGRFHHAQATLPAHDHVVMETVDGVRVTYNDPRRFGFMELWPTADFSAYPRLADLGPEPLSNAFNGTYLRTALAGRRMPIKAALLMQSIVAGLGNIYVCEALYRARISPRRLASTIGPQRAERLAEAINLVIAEAIEAGGSTLRDFAAADGALGYFQHAFRVYDREGEPCPSCAAQVRRIVQSGRSSFYCPACQR